MSTPSPVLLKKLGRAKLLTRWAAASVGVGERRSPQKGAGMEFADHREYQPGDDTRHLDIHLHARLGKNYIKQYDVYQQLPITIIIDASRSMDYGRPNKFGFACNLAATFGFVGLAGGDQVQIGAGTSKGIHWSPRLHGIQRAQHLFDWLKAQQVTDAGSFGPALRLASRHISGRGLLILISDWWADDVENEVGLLAATGQELWGIHVLSREEMEPSALGDGDVRLVDMETGHEIELALDTPALQRYRRGFEAWKEQVQSYFSHAHGRYLMVPTDQSPDKLFVQDWRTMGIIG